MQVEFRPFDSLQRQILLGVFGIILVGAGLVTGSSTPGDGGSKLATERSTSTMPALASANSTGEIAPAVSVATPKQDQTTSVAPAADAIHGASAVDTIAPDVATPTQAGAARLPGKVDIFWCDTADGDGGNREAGERVGAAPQADGRVDRVRVRPLSVSTNARPDYGIHRDIVRFDPGERPAAALLASLATGASGRSFEPAPALPGTP